MEIQNKNYNIYNIILPYELYLKKWDYQDTNMTQKIVEKMIVVGGYILYQIIFKKKICKKNNFAKIVKITRFEKYKSQSTKWSKIFKSINTLSNLFAILKVLGI